MVKLLFLLTAIFVDRSSATAGGAGPDQVALRKLTKLIPKNKVSAAWDANVLPTKSIGNTGSVPNTAVANAATTLTAAARAACSGDKLGCVLNRMFVATGDLGAALMAVYCTGAQQANTIGDCWQHATDGSMDHMADAIIYPSSSANVITKVQWMAMGSESSAKGDPHVTNMQGEKFDVLKSGARVMVQYPRESSDPSLVVTAQVVRADAKWCENTFIENVQAQGSMLGSSVSFTMGKLRAPGPFKVQIGEKSMSLSEVIKKDVSLPAPGSYISGEAKQMTLMLAEGVSIRVQLVKHSHFQFFNLDVSGLSNLPGEVGGLLGMDDHSGEAHEDCKFKTHQTKMAEDDDSSDLASLITAA